MGSPATSASAGLLIAYSLLVATSMQRLGSGGCGHGGEMVTATRRRIRPVRPEQEAERGRAQGHPPLLDFGVGGREAACSGLGPEETIWDETFSIRCPKRRRSMNLY